MLRCELCMAIRHQPRLPAAKVLEFIAGITRLTMPGSPLGETWLCVCQRTELPAARRFTQLI